MSLAPAASRDVSERFEIGMLKRMRLLQWLLFRITGDFSVYVQSFNFEKSCPILWSLTWLYIASLIMTTKIINKIIRYSEAT